MAETVKVSSWDWTVWPTMPMPTLENLRAMAEARGPSAVHDFHTWREQSIANEQHDPLVYGWEQPPVAIVRALLAGTYVPGETFRFGQGQPAAGVSIAPADWKQERTANDVVMLGGNGSGKSDVQAKFGIECLTGGDKREWRAFSQNEATSIRYIQAPAFKYLPPEYRHVKKKGLTTKISYSESTGFSENVFILGNHSAALFPTYKSYEQDKKSVEGGEADLATWDEEAMADLLKTLRFRVHKKGGVVIGGFTPVGGYTPSVAEYLDAATVLEVIPSRTVIWDWWKRTWSWGDWLLPENQVLVKGCPPGHLPLVLESGSGAGRRFAVSLPTMFNAYTNVNAIVAATVCGEYLRRTKETP